MNRDFSYSFASVRVALVAVMALAWGSSRAAHAETAETAATPSLSKRVASPLSVSGVANFPIVNLGLDVSYQVSDRFELGGQLTSTFLVHNDLSARARFFLLARPSWGIYLGANLHGIASPILLSTPAAACTLELGVEVRTEGR